MGSSVRGSASWAPSWLAWWTRSVAGGFEQAAALSFGGCTALHYLRDRAGLKAGERVLIIGALGAVGSAATQLARSFGARWATRGSQRRVLAGPSPERLEDLRTLRELAEAGKYRPLIDRVYPLESIAEARAYVDGGHKRGSVVVTVPG